MPATAVPSRFRSLLRPLRDGLAGAFGLSPHGREHAVRSMLERHRRDVVSYWFQLLVAMGLATFGLVLNSVAVVIGAMLISPLMGPLVELGMGLAIGSAVLTLRAWFRTAVSIVGVVGATALLTRTLPFDQVTAEIIARTAPTVLDLFVAALCALMAGYTTIRASSETTATAAGAAIGIALVPPLCVVGWGIGTSHWDLSKGAALLFTANFCAILALTALMFFAMGFDEVDVAGLERETAQAGRISDRIARQLRSWFGSAYGLIFRFGLPLLFAAAVFVPLRRALTQVEWEIRVRSAVERIVTELAPASQSVQSHVEVRSGEINVRLVLVGTTELVSRLKTELRSRIRDVSGVIPSVEVRAVPDAHSMQRLAKALAGPPATGKPEPDVRGAIEQLDDALRANWPNVGAGKLLGWALEQSSPALLRVEHLGGALDEASTDLLTRSVVASTGLPLTIRDLVAPREPVAAARAEARAWLVRALPLLRIFSGHAQQLFLCIDMPDSNEPEVSGVRALVQTELSGVPEAHLDIRAADGWSATLAEVACRAAPDGAAGAPNAPPSDDAPPRAAEPNAAPSAEAGGQK